MAATDRKLDVPLADIRSELSSPFVYEASWRIMAFSAIPQLVCSDRLFAPCDLVEALFSPALVERLMGAEVERQGENERSTPVWVELAD